MAGDLESLFPGWRVVETEPLASDSARGASRKAAGYGRPVRVVLASAGGERREVVLRTAEADPFGHDRPSDRAQALLLAYDTYGRIPRHVPALDVGALAQDGGPVSLRGRGEFYLVTGFAPGRRYAEDLRRIAREQAIRPLDLERCEALARYLAALHAERTSGPGYVRAVRDLLGHGEGIFGIVDGYPPDVPGAPPARLQAIEGRCHEWRWRLKGRAGRLALTHGDFHPFNVIFEEGVEFALLDASRGCQGDPADDVTCMAVNYAFFALPRPRAWAPGLGLLWRRFWEVYLRESDDAELCEVAAPFLAWRGLVLGNPHFYPALPAEARGRLLGFVERALDAPRFDPAMAEALFA